MKTDRRRALCRTDEWRSPSPSPSSVLAAIVLSAWCWAAPHLIGVPGGRQGLSRTARLLLVSCICSVDSADASESPPLVASSELRTSSLVGGISRKSSLPELEPVEEIADDSSHYLIVVDGGSTGSRLHVFHFVRPAGGGGEDEWAVVRLGSARAGVPLTAFAVHDESNNDQVDVADHLLPAFREATAWVPKEHRPRTRVLYMATAGMRLLPPEVQRQTYRVLYEQLKASPDFPFSLRLDDITTLSGDDEGYYGAVAANYLDGVVDARLRFRLPAPTSSVHSPKPAFPVVGALDMGGSSTQIVFLPESTASASTGNCTCSATAETSQHHEHQCNREHKLKPDGFFINSYLSYGVDQFRLRLWDHWIERHRRQARGDDRNEGGDESEVCEAKIIENPCVFKGYRIEHHDYTLVGTGQAKLCVREVKDFLQHTAGTDSREVEEELHNCKDTKTTAARPRMVGGVEHPPVRGKFYAMSNYFYTLDSLRQFAAMAVPQGANDDKLSEDDDEKDAAAALHHAWPNPTLDELSRALPLFCDRAWHDVLEHHEAAPHAYTQPHLLPHRCADATYMVALLRHGFGFDPNARDITYALEVNGSEVEWTLGMALVLFNDNHRRSRMPVVEAGGREPSSNMDRTCLTGTDNTQVPLPAAEADPPSGAPVPDSRQNWTTADNPGGRGRTTRDALLSSTQTLLRHMADFIETASSLDYMHTV